MEQQRVTENRSPEYRRRAILLSYIIKYQGYGEPRSFDILKRYLSYYGILPKSEEALHQEFDALLEEFRQTPEALFICGGSFCGNYVPKYSMEFARQASVKTGLPVHWTDCQGHCNEAPTACHKRGDDLTYIAPWDQHVHELKSASNAIK